MKCCLACDRIETDDALTFCRADGTPLVRGGSAGAGTPEFGSAPVAGETETRILPQADAATIERVSKSTAPTTVLGARHAAGGTRGLSARKSCGGVVIAAAASIAVILSASAYLYFSRHNNSAIDSVVVLPFQNASGDPNTEYLSDGITESRVDGGLDAGDQRSTGVQDRTVEVRGQVMNKVIAVKANDDFTLDLKFDDGSVKRFT